MLSGFEVKQSNFELDKTQSITKTTSDRDDDINDISWLYAPIIG